MQSIRSESPEAKQHTPGPWRACAGDPRRVELPSLAKTIDAGSIGNARLIAAAPDLLALAQRVAEHFADTDAPLGIAARAAIAKTTGDA